MSSLLVLLLLPVVVGGGAFFLGKRRITPLELLLQVGILCGVGYGAWVLARYTAIRDVEIWNGRVADKSANSEHCCHSYECNCHESCSGSGKDRKCHRHCDTCYRHSHDETYEATSTNGERIFHDRCNPPGSSPPRAWSAIVVGEPTAWEHAFTNYVRADPEAVLGRVPELADLQARVPPYPRVVGYRARRFLFVGVPDQDLHGALAELNADLGAKRQVNVIVVVAAVADPRFFDALRAAWLGGKKNDVVLVIGAPEFPRIAWARAMAWNKSRGAENDFIGMLTSRVEALETFDGTRVLGVLREEISARYERRPFSELAHLWSRAKPTPRGMALAITAELLLSAILTLIFWRNRRVIHGPAPHEWVGALLSRVVAPLRALRRAPPAPAPTDHGTPCPPMPDLHELDAAAAEPDHPGPGDGRARAPVEVTCDSCGHKATVQVLAGMRSEWSCPQCGAVKGFSTAAAPPMPEPPPSAPAPAPSPTPLAPGRGREVFDDRHPVRVTCDGCGHSATVQVLEGCESEWSCPECGKKRTFKA